VIDRWRKLYDPAGYDGLVVLTTVTEAAVPPRFLANGYGAQDYVLALEQGVVQHFALGEYERRLGNTSFHSGRLESSGCAGYVIYVGLPVRSREREDSTRAGDGTGTGMRIGAEVRTGTGNESGQGHATRQGRGRRLGWMPESEL